MPQLVHTVCGALTNRQRDCINEYAILLIFTRTGPGGIYEVFLGVVDVASGDAEDVAAHMESVLLTWIHDRDRWAGKVVTFAVDGLLTQVCMVLVHDRLLTCPHLRATCLPLLSSGWF